MITPVDLNKINSSCVNISQFSEPTTAPISIINNYKKSKIETSATNSRIGKLANLILMSENENFKENSENNLINRNPKAYNLLEDLIKSVELLEVNKDKGTNVDTQSDGSLTDRLVFLTNLADLDNRNNNNNNMVENKRKNLDDIKLEIQNRKKHISLNNSKENINNKTENYNPYDISKEIEDVTRYNNNLSNISPKSLKHYNQNKKMFQDNKIKNMRKYNQVSSFAEKFNNELSRISPHYGKNEGSYIMNDIENNRDLQEFWEHTKEYDQYRNLKIVKKSERYPHRLKSLSPKNSNFDKMGNRVYKF